MKQRLITSLVALCAVVITGCSNQASGETTQSSPAPTTKTADTGKSTTMPSSGSPSSEALPPEESDIGSDTAKAIALKDAGLTENDVEFIKANLDYDDGKKVYDVEFYAENKEYDYEIDASSGDIISHDYETESYDSTDKTSRNTSGKGTDKTSRDTSGKGADKTSRNTSDKGTDKTSRDTSDKSTVTLAQAKKIALKKAGLTESDGYWNKEKTDRDDGHTVYELEFISGETEYEFEIDAKNGNILEYDKESIHD